MEFLRRRKPRLRRYGRKEGMTKSKVRKRPLTKKAHIKHVGITDKTLAKYRVAVRRFFDWLKDNGEQLPNDLDDLDNVASEFVNELYQDDRPVGWASEFSCGLKKLYPKCSKKLQITSSYVKNWQKAIKRVRALPLEHEVLLAMASIAIVKKKKGLALILLVGFNGLLRANEMLTLTFGQMSILRKDTMVITLEDTKGSKRSGEVESVLIKENTLVPAIAKLKKSMAAADRIYEGTYRTLSQDILQLADEIGLKHPNLTSHGIRRGGATWYFGKTRSYDLTQEHGRWSSVKAAKAYINAATAEAGAASQWCEQRKVVTTHS